MGRVVTAAFSPGCRFTQAQGSLWQYDYGTVLSLQGLDLPTAVEIHFALVERGGESETRIGVTADGITEVKIPDALLEMAKTQDYNIYAFVYLDDGKSGQTEYKILMTVRARPKPGKEKPDTEKDHPLADAVQAVNASADRAETAAWNAAESKAAAENAAEQADKSRVAAETAAKHVDEAGRTALTGIASAKTDAVETIETTKIGAVKAVDAAGEKAIKAVTDARTAAEQSLSEAKTDGVAAIETAKTEGLQAIDKAKGDIETARSGAVKDIDAAKTSGVQAVEAVTAGIEQTKTSALEEIGDSKTAAVQAVETAENEGVAAVNAAVEAGKTNFVTDESLTLSGRAADAKVVGDELAKKADQTDLEYLRKRQNILVGSETGRRVCVTDAFEAPLEGLVLYGKSTQVTTTGAQMLDIPDGTISYAGITFTTKNGVATITGTSTDDVTLWYMGQYNKLDVLFVLPPGTYTASDCNLWSYGGDVHVKKNGTFTITEPFNVTGVSTVTYLLGTTVKEVLHPILNVGEVAAPWEPYTGGKPSPSPDYPQEIQSAGDDGNVAVSVTGKNLLDISKAKTSSLVTSLHCNITPKNGCIKVSGNATKESYISFAPNIIPIGKKVFLFLKTEESTRLRFRIAHQKESEESVSYVYDGEGFLRENTSYKTLTIQLIIMSGGFDAEVYPMITTEKDATFEPYKGEQLITFSTPNGLPGIPVDSGGNYTDSTGQQWICDEVDLERGVYVQRVYSVIVDGIDVVFSQVGPYCNINLRNMPSAKIVYASSPSAAAKSTFTSETWGFNQESGFLYLVKENYAEILNESCRRHNGEVIYALATPIETPLSETDIAAYRALTTYGPTTILETDGAGMKLDYQQDVNIVIKQLTDAIASITN